MDPVSESEVERGLVEKAKRVLPGGTFGNFPSEVVIREGRGGRVWDEGGREYVDFLLGSGPTLEIMRRPGAYERLFATGRELMGALADLLKRKGVTAQVVGEPPLFGIE